MVGAMAGVTIMSSEYLVKSMRVADREGFEPSVGFHLHTLSKRARSTTPPPVRFHDVAV